MSDCQYQYKVCVCQSNYRMCVITVYMCVSLTIECMFVQMPSTWSNTSVDISLDNLSPLGKLQKSNAPSVYQLQQQRMMQPAPGMAQPSAGMAQPAPGMAQPAPGMAQPAPGMATPGKSRPLDTLLKCAVCCVTRLRLSSPHTSNSGSSAATGRVLNAFNCFTSSCVDICIVV